MIEQIQKMFVVYRCCCDCYHFISSYFLLYFLVLYPLVFQFFKNIFAMTLQVVQFGSKLSA